MISRNVAIFLAVGACLLTTSIAAAPIFILERPPTVASSTSVLQLTPNGHFNILNPTLSPDGQRVLFSSNASGAYEVWIVDSRNGMHLQRLTSLEGEAVLPSFSPNSKLVGFLWVHRENLISENASDLCLIPSPYSQKTPGNDVQCLASDRKVSSYSWGPESNQIVYVEDGSMFVSDLSLHTRVSIPFNGTIQHPVFDTIGSRVYFSGSRLGEGSAIWRENVDGSNLTRMSWTGSDYNPQMSPDGREILYVTNYSGMWEPWLIDSSTRTSRSLFDHPEVTGYIFPQNPPLAPGSLPSWTPDGRRVVIISNSSGPSGALIIVTLNVLVTLNLVVAGGNNQFSMNVFNTVPVSLRAQEALAGPDGKTILLLSSKTGSGFPALFLLQFDLNRTGVYEK